MSRIVKASDSNTAFLQGSSNCESTDITDERGAMTCRHGRAGSIVVRCTLTENQTLAIIRVLARTVGRTEPDPRDDGRLVRSHQPGHDRPHGSILADGNRLRIFRGQALASIAGDRTINDRTAVDALPGVENEEEVGEPLQHH